MFCSFCGNQIDDSAKFCSACGNNLTSSNQNFNKASIQQQSMQNFVQHQPVEFIVQQKLLALRPVYRIKDISGRDFMEVKRSFSSLFNPHLDVHTPDGQYMGCVQGNLFRTEWKIIDANNVVHAVIHIPFLMFFNKHFSLEANNGIFQSGNSFFAYNWSCYDSNGQVSFQIDKKILAIRDSFKIISYGTLSPFITTMAAICIDERFFPEK